MIEIQPFSPFTPVNSCGTKYPAHTTCTLSVTFMPFFVGSLLNGGGVIYYPGGHLAYGFIGTGLPGNPDIKMTLAGTGTLNGLRYADIKVTNNGSGSALAAQITQITTRPGTLRSFLPFLIEEAPDKPFAVGASVTVRVFLNGTSGGVLMTLSGSMNDIAGTAKTFSSLVVLPPQS
jgi:hypothetical protein